MDARSRWFELAAIAGCAALLAGWIVMADDPKPALEPASGGSVILPSNPEPAPQSTGLELPAAIAESAGSEPPEVSEGDYRAAMELLEKQGSVLQGSVLDPQLEADIIDHARAPAVDRRRAAVAELLLRAARKLEKLPIDNRSLQLVEQLRSEAQRQLNQDATPSKQRESLRIP